MKEIGGGKIFPCPHFDHTHYNGKRKKKRGEGKKGKRWGGGGGKVNKQKPDQKSELNILTKSQGGEVVLKKK